MPFYPFLGRVPYENRLQKYIGYPYSNHSTGGPGKIPSTKAGDWMPRKWQVLICGKRRVEKAEELWALGPRASANTMFCFRLGRLQGLKCATESEHVTIARVQRANRWGRAPNLPRQGLGNP